MATKKSNRAERLLTLRQWKKIAEEARSRSDYKDRIEEVLSGGLREFYKARFAEKNNITDLVAHWDKEAYYHMRDKLFDAITHTTTFKNRKIAILGVVHEFKKRDLNIRAQAESIIAGDYPGLKSIMTAHISDDDTTKFWDVVNATVEIALKKL